MNTSLANNNRSVSIAVCIITVRIQAHFSSCTVTLHAVVYCKLSFHSCTAVMVLFSAACWFYGRNIYDELKYPIGELNNVQITMTHGSGFIYMCRSCSY